jgi:hypothetical protein
MTGIKQKYSYHYFCMRYTIRYVVYLTKRKEKSAGSAVSVPLTNCFSPLAQVEVYSRRYLIEYSNLFNH